MLPSSRRCVLTVKECGKCHKEQPISEYATCNRYKDNHNIYCKSCMREYGRANYRKNKKRYFEVAEKRDKALDELINSYKSVPCKDCGIEYPHYVMDFDHISDNKFMDISKMRKRRMAFSKIIEEIKKCEVVCSNCHRERTNSRNPSRYTKKGNF